MSRFAFLTFAALALGLIGISTAPASAFPAGPQPIIQADIAQPLIVPARHNYNGNFGGIPGGRFNGPRYNYGHYHNGYPGFYGNNFYRRPYYGRRCYGWNGYYCGGYYGGPYYGYGGFYGGPMLGFGFGSGIVVTPRRYAYTNRHVQWCLNRYRSYNPRSNTWVAYSGRVRQCISPYSR